MPPKYLTLIRHAQAFHNLTGNSDLLDPNLTPEGIQQSLRLNESFNNSPNPPLPSPPTLLVSSPLTRTLQTILISFADYLRQNPSVKVIPLAEVQETADIPCDTGRPLEQLKTDFSGKGALKPEDLGPVHDVCADVNDKIAWELLDPVFPSKEGKYAGTPTALTERARLARKWVYERDEEHVVVVLHGGFLHYMVEEWNDFSSHTGTGWLNTEFRTFTFVSDAEATGKQTYSISETEDSKRRRAETGNADKPLGKAERMEYKETQEKGAQKEELKN